jgi:hypothetical protein
MCKIAQQQFNELIVDAIKTPCRVDVSETFWNDVLDNMDNETLSKLGRATLSYINGKLRPLLMDYHVEHTIKTNGKYILSYNKEENCPVLNEKLEKE